MYEKGKAEGTVPHPRALSPPAFHITLNPLHSSCTFWVFVRMSPAPHNVQPKQTAPGPAPPSPTLGLLWSSDVPLLALYTAHSIRFWGSGFYFLFENYFSNFSLARHHSLLWKWKMCHIITQRSHELTLSVTNRTGGWNYAWKHSHRRHLLSFEETVWAKERQMKFLSSLTVKTNFICPQHFQPQPLLLNEIDEFLFIC